MGVLAAVEAWKKRDLPALDQGWTRRLKRISRVVETIPGVTAEVVMPPAGALRCPNLAVNEAAFQSHDRRMRKEVAGWRASDRSELPGQPQLGRCGA